MESTTCLTSHYAVGDHAPLRDLAPAAREARLAEGRREGREVRARGRGPGGDEGGGGGDRAVAVDAVDIDGGARLAVELAVAVAVLLEVAIDAVHPLLEVDVLQVDRLAELLGVLGRHYLALTVDQVALPVLAEDGPVDPAVAVEVGELRVLELGIEGREVGQ